MIDWRYASAAVMLLSRTLDGLDGAYARLTDQTSDFGGYLDILVDFTIYGLIPISVAATHSSQAAWIACSLLEVAFFVNAAGLFFLSALIEKNEAATKKYGKKSEVTTVKMPPALIECTEAIVMFLLIIIFCEYQVWLYALFGFLVTVTILQRLWWASDNLS